MSSPRSCRCPLTLLPPRCPGAFSLLCPLGTRVTGQAGHGGGTQAAKDGGPAGASRGGRQRGAWLGVSTKPISFLSSLRLSLLCHRVHLLLSFCWEPLPLASLHSVLQTLPFSSLCLPVSHFSLGPSPFSCSSSGVSFRFCLRSCLAFVSLGRGSPMWPRPCCPRQI